MSERVQLLLSDRILGMTLVPEGRVWNYGIGLTQLWSPNIPYSITLDTPLLFWAEEHRPAAFLTVSYFLVAISRYACVWRFPCPSSQILKRARIRLTSRTASSDRWWSLWFLSLYVVCLAYCILCYMSILCLTLTMFDVVRNTLWGFPILRLKV